MKIPILIVDDHRENLLPLESLLDSSELEIVRAESGKEALAKVVEHAFALVLIHVHLPDKDGCEMAELLRGSARSSSIPIIFVTSASMDREHIFKGYDGGPVAYLVKPLEPRNLKNKVGIFLELYRQRMQLEEKTCELDARILELEVLQKELEEKNETLELLSSLDGLTGLFNRRYFDDNLQKEWKQAMRNQSPLALLLIDIDYFKNYNDLYGHLAGDDCLRTVAMVLYEALLRPIDIVARYGGAVFAAILPDTDGNGAVMVARRMLAGVAALKIDHPGSMGGDHLTVSIGASCLLPDTKTDFTVLLDRADKALYAAKEGGRNQLRINS